MAREDHEQKADTTIDLGRIRTRFAARRGRIALAVALSALVAGGAVALRPDPSTVEMRVLIEPRAVAGEAAGDRLRREDRILATQADLFASSALARRAIAAAPEIAARVLGDGDAAGLDRATADERRAAALGESLAVARVDRSRLLSLRLTGPDSEAAGRLLDVLVREEGATLAETRARIRAEVDRRHAADLAAARERLARAEAAAAAAEPTVAEAAEAPGASALTAERTAAEVLLKQLQTFAETGADGADRAVDVAPTVGLRLLRDERGRLRARLAELSVIYLGNHPLMKAAEADLADLKKRSRAELPRAVATEKAALAEIDRRIAEIPSEPTTTGSLPAPDVAALRAAVAEIEARRDAARAAALGDTDVEMRPLGTPQEIAAPSARDPLLAAGLAGLLALLVSAVPILRTAAADRRARVGESAAADEPTPVVPSSDAAPVAEIAADPDEPRRAEAYGAAARDLVATLRDALAAQFPDGVRVAVVSTGDAARAHGAAATLAALAAPTATTGLVDVTGDAAAIGNGGSAGGLADLLDGTVAFSEALRRDRATGVWSVPLGGRPLAAADLADPAFAGILEALAATWNVVIFDVGRLDVTPTAAALIDAADAVVLAEDESEDPRALRVFEALLGAGKPTWLLEAPPEPRASEAAPTPVEGDVELAVEGSPVVWAEAA